MTPMNRGILVGALGAATLMFAGAGTSGLARSGHAQESGLAPRGTGKDTEEDAGKDTVSDESSEDSGSEAGADPEILAPRGDILRGAPGVATGRATRDADLLRLGGWLWVAQTGSGGGGRPERTRITLRALDLADTASGRRIRADGIRLFPGVRPTGAVHPGTVQVDGSGTPVRWTALVPLEEVRSGTYRGYLLATREEETNTSRRPPFALPVVVRIKDGPWAALAILILGLPLVLLLRWYRDRRQRSDSAYGRLADAEALVVSDSLLEKADGEADPFRRRFAEHLRAAAAALDADTAGSAGAAEGHVEKAERLWVAWQAGRPDWVAGLRLDHDEIRTLEALAAERPRSAHLSALLGALRTGYATAPDLAVSRVPAPEPSPAPNPEPVPEPGGENAEVGNETDTGAGGASQYRLEAERRAVRARRYREVEAELAAVRDEAAALADAEKKLALLTAVDDAKRQWNAVSDPSNDDATSSLRTQLAETVRAARIAAGLEAEEALPPAAETAVLNDPALDEPAGSELIPRRFRPRITAARDRRRVYAWTATAMLYLALVLFGFKETWGENPVFGADPLADYLGVFAWALGLNALTLAGAAAFTGSLSLPWVRSAQGAGAGTSPDTPVDEGVASPESARSSRHAPHRAPRLRRL